jgi:hypothetical protein
MAVVQISKIQLRRGLQENLPQLASAEMGWSVDERRLFIGNGTLEEGAPSTGVTEVLTTQSIYTELALIQVLQGNIANLEANVTTIQSDITSLQSNAAVQTMNMVDNTITAANTSITLSSLASKTIEYSIIRGSTSRVGTLKVTELSGTASYEDDYIETASTGVVLGFRSNVTSAIMTYTTTNTGADATFNYYIKSFT